MSLPGFYQAMARLEDAGFVEGRYQEVVIDDNKLRERVYKITSAGHRALREANEFYMRLNLGATIGEVAS